MALRLGSVLVALLSVAPPLAAADSLQFGRFGSIPVARPKGTPSQVAILLSDAGGIGPREAEMASTLAAQGALVLEIDSGRYLKTADRGQGRCLYPAADFEALSQFGQQKLGLAAYLPPVLVGRGAGAALAYGALGQAPASTFAGAVSAGFCPLVPSSRKLCPGNGLKQDRAWPDKAAQHLLPDPHIEEPWIVLDAGGPPCPAGDLHAFAKKVPAARVVPVPKGSAGAEQLQGALAVFAGKRRQDEAERARRPLPDLPLVEVPAEGRQAGVLAVVLSGSGGWVGFDRKMGKNLAERGVPVVGISSLSYFWQRRDPDGVSRDLARILGHYLAAWHKSRAIVVGYSQGADIVPFMVNRLPADLRSKVALVALIGPDGGAQFQMHPDGWMTGRAPTPEVPELPEIPRLKPLPVLCVYGAEEKDSLCKHAAPGLMSLLELPGGHGFEGAAPALADRFVASAAGQRGGVSPAGRGRS